MVEGLVLDSWPVLEWVKGKQPAAVHMATLIEDAMNDRLTIEMSRINYGEVIYMIRKAEGVDDRGWALRTFLGAPIVVASVDDALVDEATELKSKYPIAFADAFAAALAIRRGVALATGDKDFLHLEADGLLRLRWMGA